MKTIFVSSTFNDMQHERDMLQSIVANRLNLVANQYGDSVSFCDLRWGVNTLELTEQEASEKVLEVCLDEIDRSDPPMIVLLGDRYGWMPDKQILRSVAHRKSFDSLKDLEISVTALEIEYGALQNEERLNNTFFYFRTIVGFENDMDVSENEECLKKLSELKGRIKNLSRGRVREYSVTYQNGKPCNLDNFAEMVFSDLKNRFLPEWEKLKNYSPEEKEMYIQWKNVQEYNKYFSANFNQYSKLKELTTHNHLFCLVSGSDGSGKTTLLSHLACHLKNTGIHVFWMQIGLTKLSQTYTGLLQTLDSYIRKALDDHFVESGEIEQDIFMNTKESMRNLCILIDGIDILNAIEQNALLRFLTKLSQYATVVMTKTDYVKVNGVNIELNGVCEQEARKTVLNYLRLKGRELPQSIVDKTISKAANTVLDVILGTKNNTKRAMPIHLIQQINTLLMFNNDDFRVIKKYGNDMLAICKYQEEVIDTFSYDWQDQALLNIDKIINSTNRPLLREALTVLSFSRIGLRNKDFKALIGKEWNDLYLANLICFFGHMLISKNNGIYAFANESLRIACNRNAEKHVKNKIWKQTFREVAGNNISEDIEFNFTYADFFEYLNTLEDHDEIKVNEYMSCIQKGNLDFSKVISYIYQAYKSLNNDDKHILTSQFIDVFFTPCFTNELSEKYLVHQIHALRYTKDNVFFLKFVLEEISLKNEWNSFTADTFHKVYEAIFQKAGEFAMKEKNGVNTDNFIFAATLLIELLLQKGRKKMASEYLENLYVVLGEHRVFELLYSNPAYYCSSANAVLLCYTENKDKEKTKQMLDFAVHNVMPNTSLSPQNSMELYTNALKAGVFVHAYEDVNECLRYVTEQVGKKDSLSVDDIYFIGKMMKLTVKYFSPRNHHQECFRWLFERILPIMENKRDNLYLYANDIANNLENINEIYTDAIKIYIDFPTPKYMQQAIFTCEKLIDVCNQAESLYPGTFKEKRASAYALFAKCIIVSRDKCVNTCVQKTAEGLFAFAKDNLSDSITHYIDLLDYGIENNCFSVSTVRKHIEKLIEFANELLSSAEFVKENDVLIDFLEAKNTCEENIEKINKTVMFFNKNIRYMKQEHIESVKAIQLKSACL